MSKLTDKLTAIIGYYNSNKGIGHTHTMLYGAAMGRLCNVVFNNIDYAKLTCKGKDSIRALTVNDIERGLMGSNLPLVFDHYVLYVLFTECLNQIQDLDERKIKNIEKQLKGYKEMYSDLRYQMQELTTKLESETEANLNECNEMLKDIISS